MKKSKTENHVYREWTITIKSDASKRGNSKGCYKARCEYSNGIGRVDGDVEVLNASGKTVDQAVGNARAEIDHWWRSIQ